MGRPTRCTQEAQRRKPEDPQLRLRQPQNDPRPSDGRRRGRLPRAPSGPGCRRAPRRLPSSSTTRMRRSSRGSRTGSRTDPGDATGLPEGGGDVTEGENSFGNTGYNGPAPPARARPAQLLLLGLRPRPGPRAAPGLDRDALCARSRTTSSSRRASSARTATRATMPRGSTPAVCTGPRFTNRSVPRSAPTTSSRRRS